MDKNRTEGLVDKAKGSIQSTVGDAIGDRKMQTDGVINKVKGEIKNIAGGISDAAKEAKDDDCGCGHNH